VQPETQVITSLLKQALDQESLTESGECFIYVVHSAVLASISSWSDLSELQVDGFYTMKVSQCLWSFLILPVTLLAITNDVERACRGVPEISSFLREKCTIHREIKASGKRRIPTECDEEAEELVRDCQSVAVLL